MALTITLTPGTTWTVSDDVTAAKLNLTANPTISATGDTSDLDDVAAGATEGQILVFRAATGKFQPEDLPVANSDATNNLFMWAHFA